MDTQDMGDLMTAYEAELSAKARAEDAAEKAAWDALNSEQQAEINAKREARWAAESRSASAACDEVDEVDADQEDFDGEE